MPEAETKPSAEREQTDESLRAERSKADNPPEKVVLSPEETADAVIDLARQRADRLLAEARGQADRSARTATPSAPTQQRAREDKVLSEERSDADDLLRTERAEHTAALAAEREETDRDLLIERARSDGAIATRDDFLGVVSHDLKNMLHTIIGFADLIASGAPSGLSVEMTASYAKRIARSGSRMTRLVGDLLDVAGIQAGALAVTKVDADPSAVVAEAIETFHERATAGGLLLVQEVVGTCVPACFDPARILQVLANLLSNAIKFTPRGSITVRVESLGSDVHFSVTDTGVGIPPDKLESIFERFIQGDPDDRRGVGLGLYISKCIVQGHAGRIWVESKLGEGSAFHFSFPRRPAPETTAPAA